MFKRIGAASFKGVIYLAYVTIVFSGLAFGSYYFVKNVTFQKPENCKVCHFMMPFYKKWETSAHKNVPCLKCHDYSPMDSVSSQVKFITGTYTYNTRPLTNVPDANCLQTGCHEKRLIESKVNFTGKNILFDHKPHFTELKRGIKLHCRSCHSDIVQGEHVKVSSRVCFLCHFMGRKEAGSVPACGTCHTAPKDGIPYKGKSFDHREALNKGHKCVECHVEIESGTGVVPKEKCYFCHVERTEKYDDIDFVHRQHVTEKQIDCLFCHPIIIHGKIRMSEKMVNTITGKGAVR